MVKKKIEKLNIRYPTDHQVPEELWGWLMDIENKINEVVEAVNGREDE